MLLMDRVRFPEPQLEACISCFQGSKQDSGSAAFLLEKAVGHIQHQFATDKTASLDLSSLAGDDMLIKRFVVRRNLM
ncbi:hypothetical protein OSB04_009935 [Centaurea solstitialis]|uniref:Uncharacterized protein n=1 Tax=Centaurea solstitialis TaxID=347529 RepID=A0AA38WNU5_9ASTR|nr:hypothetical protein OSB04_009935 [Centaurea solstitialis]